MPLKILLWSPGFYHTGDHFRCSQFARGLVARGHEVTWLQGNREISSRFRTTFDSGLAVVTLPHWGELRIAEAIWSCQPETKLPLDVLVRCLWVAAKARRFDVIHSFHVGPSSLFPLLVAQHISKRTVCVQDWCDLWSGGILRPPGRSWRQRLDHWLSVKTETTQIARARALTVNSSYLSELATSQYGFRSQRVRVVIEGAESQTVVPENKQACRAQLTLSDDDWVVGFAGFFNPDADFLLAALRILLSNPSRRRIRLLWVGPMDDATAGAIRASAVGSAVLCVGAVSRGKLSKYLGACDVLLLPFTRKKVNLARWPAKLGDYLSAGRPVVTNATGDIHRFFLDNKHIGLVTNDDPAEFAAATLRLLNNRDMQAEYGTNARAAAESALSVTKAVLALEAFYLSLQQ